MPYLPCLRANAALPDVFAAFPATADPLNAYHEVLMRGPSPLDVAARELIAAYVSGLNACGYCHGVHTATAARFGIEPELLARLIADPASAAVEARMKPLLAYVRKLTQTPARMTAADAEAVYAAGWDEKALHDAISVCALFNFMNRYVLGLGLEGSEAYFASASQRLAEQGYLPTAWTEGMP